MEKKPESKMSKQELQKKIREMYQLKRDLYRNISNCKIVIKDADDVIDACEAELRKRGDM